MKIYKQMITKESKDTISKSMTNGDKNFQKRTEINDKSFKTDKHFKNGIENTGNKEWNELKEENERLNALVKRYEKESKNITKKCLIIRDNSRTATMETLELFRLNQYLISCLDDSKTVLRNYLNFNRKQLNHSRSEKPKSSPNYCSDKRESVSKSVNKRNDKTNQILNYFKTIDKQNESTSKPLENTRRSSPRKLSKVPETSQRKRKQNSDLDTNKSDEESDDNNKSIETPNERMGRTKGRQGKRNDTTESNNSQSSSRSKSKGGEQNEPKKPGPKRARKQRVEQEKGHYPCTFDRTQCKEIMETKEQFDFHMSGHYDAKYVCPFCLYTGPTIQIIKRHINNERERAAKEAEEGVELNEDALAHKDRKIYQCFSCKVCDEIHEKTQKRCEHIIEDTVNQCQFSHDIDFEFKDHLKKHLNETMKSFKDKEKLKNKMKPIVDKFVDELYFENNAKKDILVKTYQKSRGSPKKSNQKSVQNSSDSDWD